MKTAAIAAALLLATIDPTLGCMSKSEARSMYPRQHLYWSVGRLGQRCWGRSLREARSQARRPVVERTIAEALPLVAAPSIVPHVAIGEAWAPMALPQDVIDQSWAALPPEPQVQPRLDEDRVLRRWIIALVAWLWLVVLGILVWRYGR